MVYTKGVQLKEETRLLLNSARAKIIEKYHLNNASDDLVIQTALKNYMGE
jgi:hypothetical protein